MTDRELLEAAAKACGIDGTYGVASDDYYYDGNVEGILTILPDGQSYVWNPLTDDGDALRLMVGLRMNVHLDSNMVDVDPDGISWFSEAYGDDPLAATRRAIVRAAAEIGRSME
jgi:hypothetical protein